MTDRGRVFVAGHRGLVGSAILRRLERDGEGGILVRDRASLDLTRKDAVETFFSEERPSRVFLAAAKVGGILANDRYPADFIRENLEIQTHVIDAAFRNGVERLLFLGSSCIYPRNAPQPMTEDLLLSGHLEPTNSAYAVAKIAGIEMGRAYRKQHGFDVRALMPTNLYGPGDNFDLETSHVLPALLRKFHEAKEAGRPEVSVWGSGAPRREFLHVDDLADAAVFVMDLDRAPDLLNVGCGEDVTIRELAETVSRVVGYEGKIVFDRSKPDGTPRKLLDVSRLTALGWRATIPLEEGLRRTYAWYRESVVAP